MPYKSLLATCVIAAITTGCSAPVIEQSNDSMEPSSMVVTANPHATRVGLDVLRAGGSAVDAAVAIEAVLTLVEPQSSGLAGGAYMVHYDAQTKSISVYDGRETAPTSATKDMFFKNDTETYNFIEANAHIYGFAISYPKGQQALTGYTYEPWHIRWIGEMERHAG